MAKKTRARRDTRPRLSEAQLQAYRARRSVTAGAPVTDAEGAAAEAVAAESYSRWGNVVEEYAMIRSDLKRLALITSAMLVILVVLTFVLG